MEFTVLLEHVPTPAGSDKPKHTCPPKFLGWDDDRRPAVTEREVLWSLKKAGAGYFLSVGAIGPLQVVQYLVVTKNSKGVEFSPALEEVGKRGIWKLSWTDEVMWFGTRIEPQVSVAADYLGVSHTGTVVLKHNNGTRPELDDAWEISVAASKRAP